MRAKYARVTKAIPLLVLTLGIGANPGCAPDDSSAPSAAGCVQSGEVGTSDKTTLWRHLLRDMQSHSRGHPRGSVAPVRPPDGAGDHDLSTLELPDRVDRGQVRRYIAQILIAAAKHRRVHSSRDFEVELLERVGTENADLLIEPLAHVDLEGLDLYLVQALKRLTNSTHKELVLGALPRTPALIALVVSHDWTEDAAPILFRALKKRSRHLHPDWVVAAATVAGPEHYDDLKFQLAEGQHPLGVWNAIRALPGMEPLDEFIGRVWRGTVAERHHRYYDLAAVAAHYGHVDALGTVTEWLSTRPDWWDMFQSLTTIDPRQLESRRNHTANAWFLANRERLEFDRTARKYYLRD